MKVYQVLFENNNAVSAHVVNGVEHGDMEMYFDGKSVKWIALKSINEETAVKDADRIVKKILKP